MILVLMNHRELTTESNSNKLSIMRFYLEGQQRLGMDEEGSAYLAALFEQHLVVLAQGNTEDDGGDVFEAVNPLLPFTSLPANIKHAGRTCQPAALLLQYH